MKKKDFNYMGPRKMMEKRVLSTWWEHGSEIKEGVKLTYLDRKGFRIRKSKMYDRVSGPIRTREQIVKLNSGKAMWEWLDY
jgi:hypothetical protein